jgi:hypothetical protein
MDHLTKPERAASPQGVPHTAGAYRDEANPHSPAYSPEPIATITLDSPRQQLGASQPFATAQAGPASQQMPNTRLHALLDFARKFRQLSFAEISAFLKRTRRRSLTAAGSVFGLIALFGLVERTAFWYTDMRERRHELAVNTVTPERLIARCGAAEQDVSKAVYPILLRTMNYPARGNRTLTLAFSRTAEEKSDWVFLSMKDENGSSYDAPDAKIAALPCLDSTK